MCRGGRRSENMWVHIFIQGLSKEQVLLIYQAKSSGLIPSSNTLALGLFHTVPLGDWLEKKKVPAIIIKQQFGFPMSTT